MKFNLSCTQYLALVGLIILISSCGNGRNNSTSIPNNYLPKVTSFIANKPVNNEDNKLPYVMGGTYDSMSDYPDSATTCLNAGNNLDNIKIVNPQATIFFTEAQSLQEVENALGLSISMTVGWGLFSVTATYSYANSSQDDAYTLNINYIYQYAGTAVFKNNISLQGESALTSNALSVLGSPTAFRQMCGDNFISQMDAGASVLIRLTLVFNSTEEKNYFQSTFLNKVTGLANVLSIIETNPSGVTFHLTASGIQVGGNPNNLNQIFSQNGGGINSSGYNELDCGTNAGNPQCVNLVNQVMTYASTIANQLNNVGDYYLSNPTVSPWSTIGVYAGDVNPNQQVLTAMQQITNTYNSDQKTYHFINEYQNMLSSEAILSSQMQNYLSQLSDIYQQILAIYLDPNSDIMDCYDGFVSTDCLTIRNKVMAKRGQILNSNPLLNNVLAYIESSQYATKLIINNTPESNIANCTFYPISYESDIGNPNNLYAVNCNGQVSSSFNPESGIHIVPNPVSPTLQIDNLNYKYMNTSHIINQFNYQFNDLLTTDPFYTGSYTGNALVSINEKNNFNIDFLITNLFY